MRCEVSRGEARRGVEAGDSIDAGAERGVGAPSSRPCVRCVWCITHQSKPISPHAPPVNAPLAPAARPSDGCNRPSASPSITDDARRSKVENSKNRVAMPRPSFSKGRCISRHARKPVGHSHRTAPTSTPCLHAVPVKFKLVTCDAAVSQQSCVAKLHLRQCPHNAGQDL